MHRQHSTSFLKAVLGAFMVLMILMPMATFGQSRRATVTHIEGATRTWRVIGQDGRVIEVEVPSQSAIDIKTGKAARRGAGGKATSGAGEVSATVVAVDTITNRIKVRTQQGQVIELDTPTKDVRLGTTVVLVVP